MFGWERGGPCAGHLSVSLAVMETGIVLVDKSPHGSSYNPENLLEAGGQDGLIKKALSPCRHQSAGQERAFAKAAVGRRGCEQLHQHGQDAGLKQQHRIRESLRLDL